METATQCDVVLVATPTRLGRVIRWFEREHGDKASVNHAALVVRAGGIVAPTAVTAGNPAVIIEANSPRVRSLSLADYARDGYQVAIYRPLNLDAMDRYKIIEAAIEDVGKRYGYAGIVADAVDLGLLRGRYVLRRLLPVARFPRCSHLLAQWFQAAGYSFGCEPGCATPDDVWDFVRSRPDKYRCVHELGALSEKKVTTKVTTAAR